MAKKKKRPSSHTLKTVVEVGAVLTAAAVAGAYFLYGKDGAKNRKKVRSWAIKARGEALEKLENLKEISEPAYHKAINEVAAKYEKLSSVDNKELAHLKRELRGYWPHIKKHKSLKKSK